MSHELASLFAAGFFYLLVLFLIGGINTAISLFYYLRIVKLMVMDADPEDRGPVYLPLVVRSYAGTP